MVLDSLYLTNGNIFSVAQDDTITWAHDFSNTSGFTQVQDWNSSFTITNGTMISDGDKVTFTRDPVVNNQYHGPVFVHEFNDSFQFAAVSLFYIRFYGYTIGYQLGEIQVNLVDENYTKIYSARHYDRNGFSAQLNCGNKIYPLVGESIEDYKGYISDDGELGPMYLSTGFSIDENHDFNSTPFYPYGTPTIFDLSTEDGMRRVKYLVIELGMWSDNTADLGITELTLEYSTNDVLFPTTTTSVTNPTTSSSSNTENSALGTGLFPLLIIGIIVACIVIGSKLYGRQLSSQKHSPPSLRVMVPDFVIPQEKLQTESEIRIVRLPAVCPSCKGPVIEEDIDWTGPLQAKCNYCGHPIRAELE